ncbi:MAG: hypothetical protein GYA62_02630, partial [Bacteroidales bacterium]|nr:hypothetical protein [Bacteroidales bacterium]
MKLFFDKQTFNVAKMKIAKLKKWFLSGIIILAIPVFFAFNDDVDFEIVKNLDIYYSLF